MILAIILQHIPALCRKDVQLSGIRQHFYPEGGWGWVVVFFSSLAHCVTIGLLLSGGMLRLEMMIAFHPAENLQIISVLLIAWSISLIFSPIVTTFCSTYSPRLVAVAGGLIINLAFLFTSFSNQLHQVFISYGLLLPIGCSAVRDSSSIMVGQYFKERRPLAETVVLSGIGVGLTLFSLIYRQALG